MVLDVIDRVILDIGEVLLRSGIGKYPSGRVAVVRVEVDESDWVVVKVRD